MDVLKHKAAQELLKLLAIAGTDGMPLGQVPADLRKPNLLTVLDSEGLIQFGRRNHIHDGTGRLILEIGFDWTSWTDPGFPVKPIAEFLPAQLRLEPKELRPWVKLTNKGNQESAKISLDLPKAESTSKRMTANEVLKRAVDLTAKNHFDSKNKLAKAIGCSPTNRALVAFWQRSQAMKPKRPKVEQTHEIGIEDDQLQKLIDQQEGERLAKEQAAEMRAEGKSRRLKV